MKIWFLRVAVDDMPISASQLRTRRVVPVLFRDIPLSECSLDLSEDNVRALVDRHYTGSSAGTRGQVAGSLLRFFHQVQVGDVLAVCLNRNPNLLFGEVIDGSLSEFPGITEQSLV
jgi:predicted Mrr-cat superfamily restriction endonuclease